MRACHLFADRTAQPKTLVTGLNEGTPIIQLRETQGDTLTVYAHEFQRNPDSPALTTFVEKPLVASAVRASIGYIDAAPQSGTFRLKVGAETTTELTWPDDLSTAALIATWKAEVLAALNALAGDQGDARLDDPAGTPAHIFYFTWIDATRTDVIEVVSNRLIPWIEATVTGSVIPVGYTQMVKLARFPIRMSGAFAQATTPPVTIIETVPGSTGTNEEQTLIIPAAASGSFSLQWSGGSTKTMAVATVTAASLADALNAIVPDGDTNPSFAVEVRAAREGKRFAIAFTGPLAGAAQAALVPAMHDQQGAPFWTGTLVLEGLGLEMALNGEPTVTLTFELVITLEGEETYLLPIVIENDMTNPGTLTSAEEAGGIITVTNTIYIGADMGEPMILASPGLIFTPPEAGNTLVITHGLGTWLPKPEVTLLEVDPDLFAAALVTYPDLADLELALAEPGVIIGSHEITRGEYGEHATTANVLRITLPWELVDDPSDVHDFRLLRVAVSSPVQTLQAWAFNLDWDHVLESLPSGQTLRAKLTALEAAIGLISGSLNIPPTALDLPALTRAILAALKTSPEFTALFQALLETIVAGDTAIANTIATQLATSANFLATLTTLFANTTLLDTLATNLATNNTFQTELKPLIFEALQNGASLPEGVIAFEIEDFHLATPPFRESETAGIKTRTFEPLPCALLAVALGAPIVGMIGDETMVEGSVRPVGSAGARVKTLRGRSGMEFAAGTILARQNGIVYPVRKHDATTNTWWPLDAEKTIAPITLYADQLPVPSRFLAEFVVQAQLLGDVAGKVDVVFEAATISTGAQGSQELAPLAELFAQVIALSAARSHHQFRLEITRTLVAEVITLTGKVFYLGIEHAITLPALPFKLRIASKRFDSENIDGAQGCLRLDVVSPAASIVPLA